MGPTVLFILPYPLESAPSQRFRVEAYFSLLKQHNIFFDTREFFDKKAWEILYKKGSVLKKMWAVVKGFSKRLFLVLFKCKKYQYIFIHREAGPLGPPFFEWWLAKILRKKIIYDFDDAIWIPNVTQGNQLVRFIKCFWKVKWICKWSDKVSAGNDYLASYAWQYARKVVINPTCVDTESKYIIQGNQSDDLPVIGWTGSHSTIRFLVLANHILRKLEDKENFSFLVICDKKPVLDLQSLQFKPWTKESEITDLSRIDIGIMPLKEDAWSEGKCGFKLIQYLALGIPAVASPVGVNKKIIDHGVNGYLCSSDDEWIQCLTELLKDKAKREEFGKNGRQKIVEQYSIASNASNFLSLFSN